MSEVSSTATITVRKTACEPWCVNHLIDPADGLGWCESERTPLPWGGTVQISNGNTDGEARIVVDGDEITPAQAAEVGGVLQGLAYRATLAPLDSLDVVSFGAAQMNVNLDDIAAFAAVDYDRLHSHVAGVPTLTVDEVSRMAMEVGKMAARRETGVAL